MKRYVNSLIDLKKKEMRKKRRRVEAFALISLFIIYRGIFSLILMSSNIEITAHRGSTNIAPENTIASVIEAIALDVNSIEIDVQMSKDGEVFLLHDSSFKRTAKVRAYPWSLSYEEIKAINVGAYKTDTVGFYAPLLDEVIKICSLSSVDLNVELKDYGHSQQLPDEVIKIIKENDFIDKCVITSSSKKLLRKVRDIEPSIKIGLITSSTNLATYISNRFVDFYSVSYLALSPSIAVLIHSMQKEIYCWTPNNRIAIESAIRSGVDNIITNNVTLAKFLVVSKKEY